MQGVLLINLGTPDAPDVPDVRRYLAEFLSDPRVLDMHPAARWLLLHGVILRTRPARSAHAYKKIWTPQGSPLLLHSQALARALQAHLGQGYKVALGMRYGKPPLADALASLQQAGCDDIVAIPLYPQYSSAATASATDALFAAASALPAVPGLRLISEFHADPGFIDAVATVAREQLDGFSADHVLMSYHGVPEHQVRKSEIAPAGATPRCLASPDCCAVMGPHNRQCYRAQCFDTSRLLAAELGLAEGGWSVAFQSRLGKVPWIRPYTDEVLQALAARGVKRLAVLTPSFTADCLETLEEIAMTGQESFRAAGGEDFRMVPCVNAHPRWVQAVAAMVTGVPA